MLKQTPREFYYTFNNGPSHLSLFHVTFDSKKIIAGKTSSTCTLGVKIRKLKVDF